MLSWEVLTFAKRDGPGHLGLRGVRSAAAFIRLHTAWCEALCAVQAPDTCSNSARHLFFVFSVHKWLGSNQKLHTLQKHVETVHTMPLRRTKRADHFFETFCNISAKVELAHLRAVHVRTGSVKKTIFLRRPSVGSLGCVEPLTVVNCPA